MRNFKLLPAVIGALQLALLASCNSPFKKNNYTAYFGGEILNPTSRYILFCRGDEVIDTILLKEDNTFFKTFDSLTPGLYSFRHNPEYQYVYFEKNDSLMVHVNTKNFDESIVFCGRGDQKNNYLMEAYLKNEKYRDNMYSVFDYDVDKFTETIDASQKQLTAFYEKNKTEIQWTDEFDVYARAAVDYPFHSIREIYPVAHQMRTGNAVFNMPPDYYTYRKSVDYNNKALAHYSPYVAYLSHMLNNLASGSAAFSPGADQVLRANISKIKIADTLIKDASIKNTVINNIAFTYLLEDQNMINNQKFLQTYHAISTDTSQHNEITKIGNAILTLQAGKPLPEVTLIDKEGNAVSSEMLRNKKTVIFCWSDRLNSHFIAAHKKVLDFAAKYPDYQFVAINLDNDQDKWTSKLSRYKFPGILQYRSGNFEEIKDKWAITKIHRTLILNADGTIKNGFVNLFDANFEQQLSDHSVFDQKAITSR